MAKNPNKNILFASFQMPSTNEKIKPPTKKTTSDKR